MLLLPVITFAVGANNVELDYNVQIGPSKAISTSTTIARPTARSVHPDDTALHIRHADSFAFQNRPVEGLQFSSRHTQGLAFQNLRFQGFQFASRHPQGFAFQNLRFHLPAGPWPERANNLPIIPGGRDRVMIPPTRRP